MDHDIFRVNNQYCMYVASLGDFGELSYNTKHNVKKRFGKIAYYFSGVLQVLHLPYNNKLDVIIDDVPFKYETPLCLVMNSKNIAGFGFNKKGHLNDGLLDVFIIKGKGFKGLINTLLLFIFGLLKIKTDKVSYFFRSNKFTIDYDYEKYWSFDGEKGTSGRTEFECIHNGIKVISNLK